MLFNSLNFAFFLPTIFLLYWLLGRKNLRTQNLLLLTASYFFYACWDWRFLFLLIFSTFLDYFTGLKMDNASKISVKKFWFWLSISINIGLLGVFKYYNFFVNSIADSISFLNFNFDTYTLKLVLPVGISFYTFHGLSYVIDIYKNRIPAEKDFIDYSLFVSFFPLLVAGPIERATHLLPQLKEKKQFDYEKAVDGLKQILWGLFKKIVIADNCAEFANQIFNNSEKFSGSTLLLGAVLFAFQIYGDFSGYSDIALGTAKLFGIELLKNFSFPYFSRDIAEFWRRWHISLSTWFRDYLYIPLGGSKGGQWMKIRNTFIIFLVSGFWHGANWTFIVWGLLNALYIMPSIILHTNRDNLEIVAKGRLLPSFREFLSMTFTFTLTVFAWIVFRANSITHAFDYISTICSASIFAPLEVRQGWLVLLIILFMTVEWIGREQDYAIAVISRKIPLLIRWIAYFSILGFIFYFQGDEQQFVYFQF